MRRRITMSGFSLLYLFWFILNTFIFIMSGYPQKVVVYLKKLPFIDVHWTKFFEYSNNFYLITGMNITYYDITEYVLTLLVPLFVTYLYRALKPKKLKYQKARIA